VGLTGSHDKTLRPTLQCESYQPITLVGTLSWLTTKHLTERYSDVAILISTLKKI